MLLELLRNLVCLLVFFGIGFGTAMFLMASSTAWRLKPNWIRITMDLLSIGGGFLRDKLKAYASVEVTLIRGDQSIQVRATRGLNNWNAGGADQNIMEVQLRDFIMDASQFAEFGLPREFDQIQDQDTTYVLLPINGEQYYRFSDPGRTMIRVHSKAIT